MSLPSLPDVFGNYALGDFNEVVSPPGIDWWPQTPGWYVVGAALLAWASRRLWLRLQHWHRNRYRKEASNRLRQLSDSATLVAELNGLLKLTALAAFSRQQVAPLSGKEWTSFLNAQCEQPSFSDDQCQILAFGVYQDQRLEQSSAQQLIDASLCWIEQHKNRYDD